MDIFLWLIVAAFVVWEVYAHYVARNREAHTLSNRIWALEQRWPLFRVVVFLSCLVLATHLTLHLP